MTFSFSEWLIRQFSKWLLKAEPPRHSYLSDFEKVRYEVRIADVILIEGRHRISNIIKQVTQSPWSHAALYIGRLHDIADPAMRVRVKKHFKGSAHTQLLIESVLGHGTVIVPLAKYRKEHVRICRSTGLTYEDAQRVINFTINRLGTKYNIRHIVDLLRFLLPYGFLPRRWRSTLFTQNAMKPTEDICSTILGEAFGSVHFPILPQVQMTKQQGTELIRRNPKLLTPSDFDYSPYFSIIKYPIFSLNTHVPYRRLPWNQQQLTDGHEPYTPKPLPAKNKTNKNNCHKTNTSND